jgi:hypothetical protein
LLNQTIAAYWSPNTNYGYFMPASGSMQRQDYGFKQGRSAKPSTQALLFLWTDVSDSVCAAHAPKLIYQPYQ